MGDFNPHNLPVEKSKVLIGFEAGKRQEFEFVDTVAIINPKNRGVCSMDRIRQDNGERVYFAGIQGDMSFVYVDEKFTEVVE